MLCVCYYIISQKRFLQPVFSIFIISHNTALPTLEYILRKVIIVFFILVRSRDITLIFIFIMVSFSEVLDNSIDLLFFGNISSGGIANDDLIRSSYKATFVPLMACYS